MKDSKPLNGSPWKRQTESFSPDEPVVLLRLRAPEDLKTDTGQPCDGIMIWFDKPRFPEAIPPARPKAATAKATRKAR